MSIQNIFTLIIAYLLIFSTNGAAVDPCAAMKCISTNKCCNGNCIDTETLCIIGTTPASFNTPVPTTATRLTLKPTSSTPSPTSDTSAPTAMTGTPTKQTSSPTLGTAAPTAITGAPTKVTPSPTLGTTAPTAITGVPTKVTPSPTSITADTTVSSTQSTPVSTDSTNSATTITGASSVSVGGTSSTTGKDEKIDDDETNNESTKDEEKTGAATNENISNSALSQMFGTDSNEMATLYLAIIGVVICLIFTFVVFCLYKKKNDKQLKSVQIEMHKMKMQQKAHVTEQRRSMSSTSINALCPRGAPNSVMLPQNTTAAVAIALPVNQNVMVTNTNNTVNDGEAFKLPPRIPSVNITNTPGMDTSPESQDEDNEDDEDETNMGLIDNENEDDNMEGIASPNGHTPMT